MEEEFGVDTTGVAPGTEIGASESLTPYVGPYVTDMLGKGAALADTPYDAYMGPLTAGASDLQTTAFEGLGSLNIPTDTMGTYAPQEFTAEAAQGLMNPYLMAALQPQIDEARRQSDIERQRTAGRLLGAGTFGGGRQAVMEAENTVALQEETVKYLEEVCKMFERRGFAIKNAIDFMKFTQGEF